jgi:hypothetical protein
MEKSFAFLGRALFIFFGGSKKYFLEMSGEGRKTKTVSEQNELN